MTAFLTAYYTFRLYFRVFEGPLVLPPDVEPATAHGHARRRTRRSAARVGHATTPSTAPTHTGTTHDHGVDEHLASGARRRTRTTTTSRRS